MAMRQATGGLPDAVSRSSTGTAARITATLTPLDGTYPGSDTEIWGPYIWSVYRDTLTFKNAGSGGPCVYVKPWRKIGK